LDVRYILEHGSDPLYAGKAKTLLEEKINGMAHIPGIDRNLLLSRINAPHSGEGVIEVSLKRTDSIDKAQPLKEREYIVALKEDDTHAGISMPNYTASSAIGLSLAALRVAKETVSNAVEYESMRDNAWKRLVEIYKRSGIETNDLTKDVVDMMVSGGSDTRLYYAVMYALPPIVKAAIEELRKYHEALHILLQSA
jgi:hypothetical protein